MNWVKTTDLQPALEWDAMRTVEASCEVLMTDGKDFFTGRLESPRNPQSGYKERGLCWRRSDGVVIYPPEYWYAIEPLPLPKEDKA